jgi:hypothetical protein
MSDEQKPVEQKPSVEQKPIEPKKVWAKRTKQQKRDAIKAIEEAAKKRTPEEQLHRLDQKFGVGLGAKKERAKLLQRIEDRKKPKKEEPKPPSKEDREKKRMERIDREHAKEEKLKVAEEAAQVPKDKLVEEVIKEEEEKGEDTSVTNKRVRRIMKKHRKGGEE